VGGTTRRQGPIAARGFKDQGWLMLRWECLLRDFLLHDETTGGKVAQSYLTAKQAENEAAQISWSFCIPYELRSGAEANAGSEEKAFLHGGGETKGN